jgi:hypothetical protein
MINRVIAVHATRAGFQIRGGIAGADPERVQVWYQFTGVGKGKRRVELQTIGSYWPMGFLGQSLE